MKTVRILRCVFAVWMGVMGASQTVVTQVQPHFASSPLIQVESNVQVSTSNLVRDHIEVSLASDPHNPLHLLACAMIAPQTFFPPKVFNAIVYSSFDGGKNWEVAMEHSTGSSSDADPTCAFGPEGSAYFAFLSFEASDAGQPFSMQYHSRLLVYRSTDGGKSWLKPTELPIVDRPFLTVDMTKGKYGGRVYINATGFARGLHERKEMPGFIVFHSASLGDTFQPPVSFLSKAWVRPSSGVVLSDGTFIAGGREFDSGGSSVLPSDLEHGSKPTGSLIIFTSTDGGDLFSSAIVASDDYPGEGDRAMPVHPILATDSSEGPFHDRVYCVWSDFRSGRSDVLSIYSSDKGKTWSQPIGVNDDQPRTASQQGPDDYLPAVAVNRYGVVGVMWYDRRDQPDNLGYEVRFAVSLDGGESFSPSLTVSEQPTSFTRDHLALRTFSAGGGHPIKSARGGRVVIRAWPSTWPGDTAGLAAADDGSFHALWVDNRTGPFQMWTARLRVQGNATLNGSADLASLDDVTDKLAFDISDSSFNRTNETVKLTSYLVNTSTETILAPLKVRALSLGSKIGKVAAANADNKELGSGAIWDFSDVLVGGKLGPGERSKGKQLVFKLTGARTLDSAFSFSDESNPPDFVKLDAKILGKLAKIVPARKGH